MIRASAPLGKIDGRGYIKRADGTVVEFVLTGEATPAQVAEFLKQEQEEMTDGRNTDNRSA